MTLSTSSEKPQITFGVLADVQYADIEDRPAWYDTTKTRYYRASLTHVRQAFEHWLSNGVIERPRFALQLGDLIDGLNRNSPRPMDALHKTLQQFDERVPVFHVLGNHELYNFKRRELVSLLRENLKMATHPHHDNHHLYYSFSPQKGVKIIALDCFEISTIGYNKDDYHYKEAAATLTRYHGHEDHLRWDEDGPLQGLDRRYQEQNGGLSMTQLAWLDKELSDSDSKHERVFVFGHCCLHPDSCEPTCLVWNYDEVMSLMGRHPSVVVYLSGHAHQAGNATDVNGIHYLVFHGVIETSPMERAFATLSLYNDRLEVHGEGEEPSLSLPLRNSYGEEYLSTVENAASETHFIPVAV